MKTPILSPVPNWILDKEQELIEPINILVNAKIKNNKPANLRQNCMEIRPARKADFLGIAHVKLITWQSAYRNIISESYLANLSESNIAKHLKEPIIFKKRTDFKYVAVNDNQEIIGFVMGRKAKTKISQIIGEIGAIYILPPYQRQGIGKKLMQTASFFLKKHQMIPFLLWVLEENPARGFYEHLGGKFLQYQEIKIGDQYLQEIAYRFDEIIS
jgi:ribosomal protein S18 acetylase RimI-like enzyme